MEIKRIVEHLEKSGFKKRMEFARDMTIGLIEEKVDDVAVSAMRYAAKACLIKELTMDKTLQELYEEVVMDSACKQIIDELHLFDVVKKEKEAEEGKEDNVPDEVKNDLRNELKELLEVLENL